MSEERKPVNQQQQQQQQTLQNQQNPQHHQNAHNHKSGSSSTGAALLQVVIISAVISLVIAGTLFFALGSKSAKIAYIDTGKLLVGFSEADNVERAVKVEDDKWQVELKILQDSLAACRIADGLSKFA